MPAGHSVQPIAILHSLEPTHGNHRLVRVVKVGVFPEWRHWVASSLEEKLKISVPHLAGRHLESIHGHTMHRALRVLA
jgi:hypothetical protein